MHTLFGTYVVSSVIQLCVAGFFTPVLAPRYAMRQPITPSKSLTNNILPLPFFDLEAAPILAVVVVFCVCAASVANVALCATAEPVLRVVDVLAEGVSDTLLLTAPYTVTA